MTRSLCSTVFYRYFTSQIIDTMVSISDIRRKTRRLPPAYAVKHLSSDTLRSFKTSEIARSVASCRPVAPT